MDYSLPDSVRRQIIAMQKGEITEHYVYLNIAKRVKNPKNRAILKQIGADELSHYNLWTEFLGVTAKPTYWKIIWYGIINFLLGYTFTLKIMERGEKRAQINYIEICNYVADAERIAHDEDIHEKELIDLLDEERLNYVGSMVLGLNDALVELTGALAGLTFAITDTRLISLSGLITGIAASFSMAASQYLSAKADGRKDALKSSVYTGIAYIITVTILIMPYLLIQNNRFLALGIMLASVVIIIFGFNYYISVAKNLNFRKRFFQMIVISLGVASLSFLIGTVVKMVLGINI
ncbi:MAG: VIT1/CCC1 transporter family protein [Candidatus Izemoplasmatales bacterium]|jgi:VIT1/CCC1 family predicted Fe2+/Mn2+ transporter|nr:VIT1/CCC1 transporter family protein [Candidatus Izemoplasmatales bacterium]MDD3864981.1 VIT1/CCC1 transporter family protein [Candidatus Izemoplasmatales bacterium]